MHLSYVYNIPKLIMFNPFLFVCLFVCHILSVLPVSYLFFHILQNIDKNNPRKDGWEKNSRSLHMKVGDTSVQPPGGAVIHILNSVGLCQRRPDRPFVHLL